MVISLKMPRLETPQKYSHEENANKIKTERAKFIIKYFFKAIFIPPLKGFLCYMLIYNLLIIT